MRRAIYQGRNSATAAALDANLPECARYACSGPSQKLTDLSSPIDSRFEVIHVRGAIYQGRNNATAVFGLG